MQHRIHLAMPADRRVSMPLDLNRAQAAAVTIPEKADTRGLSRALTLAVPVSALLWLFAGVAVASLVH